ncbi:hypothetical protein H310_07875 [Aphanomyces invadans]|uniref:Uncharacterized protein n=1 Tax=Aphanomyces invadans TaxID=157072 RepID=A0A024U0Q3_9STRA|nr:hypothetical protein H310_07875 [Aphanomyces invadans]ETV99833.1 hypothetical protein H310_07875 [Aphanomyces invadans]|eukprot:XP_008871609.1 hypothetical protein H310_07875 [Aphanomyces invadans]
MDALQTFCAGGSMPRVELPWRCPCTPSDIVQLRRRPHVPPVTYASVFTSGPARRTSLHRLTCANAVGNAGIDTLSYSRRRGADVISEKVVRRCRPTPGKVSRNSTAFATVVHPGLGENGCASCTSALEQGSF